MTTRARTETRKPSRKPDMARYPSELSRGAHDAAQALHPLSLPLPDGFIGAVAERVARLLPEHDDGYLDVQGAAEFLACPRSRIYALVSKRAIPYEKDGSRLLFDRRELRAWVQQGGGTR